MLARFRTRPSLYRDFTLLSVFIIFLLLLVSIWVAYETYLTHSERVVKQLETESLRIDRALIIEIESASYLLDSVGRQLANYGTDDIEIVAQFLHSFNRQAYSKRNWFGWINTDQELVVSSDRTTPIRPIDVSDRDYMKKAITEPWKIHIGSPTESRLTGKWIIPISMGLTNDQGNFIGALVISLDIESLSRAITKVIKQPGISFAVTNQAFTLLTQVSDDPNFYTRHFNVDKLASIDFAKQPSGLYSETSFLSASQIFAYYEKSSQYPYVILVGYDPAFNQQAIQDILLPRLFQLIVIALFLLVVLWTVRRRIIAPVVDLCDVTAGFANGGTIQALDVDGPTEIENLAFEIRRLCEYLLERRRIEEELRLRNRDLSKIKASAELTNQVKAEFFEHVGQELAQPLSVIREHAESLQDELFGPLGNRKYQDNANEIVEQTEHLLAIIQDIKSISEAESGLLILQEEALDLNSQLTKCVRIFQEKLRGADIQVQLQPEENLPQLCGDELRIKQLILNLMNGAASQMKPGDTMRIATRTEREGISVLFEYVPSIKEMRQSRRMQPFAASTELGRRPASLTQSRGLGMALSRLLVAVHQGTIETRNTGERVMITLRFPRHRLVAPK